MQYVIAACVSMFAACYALFCYCMLLLTCKPHGVVHMTVAQDNLAATLLLLCGLFMTCAACFTACVERH